MSFNLLSLWPHHLTCWCCTLKNNPIHFDSSCMYCRTLDLFPLGTSCLSKGFVGQGSLSGCRNTKQWTVPFSAVSTASPPSPSLSLSLIPFPNPHPSPHKPTDQSTQLSLTHCLLTGSQLPVQICNAEPVSSEFISRISIAVCVMPPGFDWHGS